VDVPWDQATRGEARDFCRYLQIADKPRPPQQASVPVPGKRPASVTYAPSTVAHCETVCRGFYDYHLEAGTGPLVNPFPLARPGRASSHHNPMNPFPKQKAGLFRPRVPRRVPKQIPDEAFNDLFARLPSNRDRALVAFWISTGARASELLGAVCSGADPGQQLITVIRKGSRAVQALPASPDAFVWLRLYQQQMHGLVPSGPDDPLWWTLRRPFRPLNYHAARAMFDRANAAAGTGWPLHALRHTAAYRLARDPDVPISDVQWVLAHRSLATTQIYVVPTAEDVIKSTLAHHRRQAGPKPAPQPGPGYRPESLDVLFGKGRW
jgi:site-specific recombinase XerD